MTDFPFDIVGFDLDGTLLDTHRDLGVALNHALGLIQVAPVTPEQVRTLVGAGTRTMLARALTLRGVTLPEDETEALALELIGYYGQNIAGYSHLFPGTADMLAALGARGVKLAVVTNKPEHLAIKLMETLELTGPFFTIIGGDTLGPGRAKPKPDLIFEMIARSGLTDPRVAYVGDSSFDTGAAAAAGVPCVAVSFGFNDKPADQLGAQAVIDHYDELIGALETLG